LRRSQLKSACYLDQRQERQIAQPILNVGNVSAVQVCACAKLFLRQLQVQAMAADGSTKCLQDVISVLLSGLAHGNNLIVEDLPYGPGTSQKILKVWRVLNSSMDPKTARQPET
jgi:hypothetical protein